MQTIELVSEEQVLDAVKEKGPVIPMEVRHVIKSGDSIIIGATLSTLVGRGIVLITNIKRGGSPFYYVKGQEEKLADLSKFLNDKDRKTFETLKQKQIIRDKAEDPLTRVSLRNIPDFAKRLDVEIGGEKEIFWKWYLLPTDDALKLLTKNKDVKETKEAEKNEESGAAKENIGEKKEKTLPVVIKETEKENFSKEKKQKEPKQNAKKEGFLEVKAEVQQQLDMTGQPQIVAQFNDGFINKISSFLSEGKIIIKEVRQIKKGTEYDLSLEIPTPIGNVDYFCKAKSKKKCSESDLSSAYLQGQNLRLPVLFLTTGEVAKKAREKAKSDFKGLAIKEI